MVNSMSSLLRPRIQRKSTFAAPIAAGCLFALAALATLTAQRPWPTILGGGGRAGLVRVNANSISSVGRAVGKAIEKEKARFRLLQEVKRQPSSRTGDIAALREEGTEGEKGYAEIDKDVKGFRVLNQDPPVYLIDGFLADEDCDALIQTANEGGLERVKYSGSFVLLDHNRLWPVFPMLAASALPAAATHTHEATVTIIKDYLESLAPNAAIVGSMLLLVPRIVESLSPILTQTSGANFKGTKWVGLKSLPKDHPARVSYENMMNKATSVFKVNRAKFERPTLTRYQKGEGQAVHADAYPPAEPGKREEYLRGGGQRLAQCLIYLNDIPTEDGGGTKFFHPSLNGLTVQPKKGSALVFFPAFSDGSEDLRMMHSGETYLGEDSKWLLGTWLHEADVPVIPHRLEAAPGAD